MHAGLVNSNEKVDWSCTTANVFSLQTQIVGDIFTLISSTLSLIQVITYTVLCKSNESEIYEFRDISPFFSMKASNFFIAELKANFQKR